MRTQTIFFATFVLLFALFACEKDVMRTNLDDFYHIKPDGWDCEIIKSGFNSADIPQNADTPMAIVKYYNKNKEFEGFGQRKTHPSLILNFYPIDQKEKLLKFIKSQQIFSWCIPIYFGETKDYFIITSPCFKNSGVFTENANSSIADLYVALDRIMVKKEY